MITQQQEHINNALLRQFEPEQQRQIIINNPPINNPPINIHNPPINIHNPPIRIKNPPINITNPPINIHNPPINVNNPPVNVNVTNPPINVTNPPINITNPPVNVNINNPLQNTNDEYQNNDTLTKLQQKSKQTPQEIEKQKQHKPQETDKPQPQPQLQPQLQLKLKLPNEDNNFQTNSLLPDENVKIEEEYIETDPIKKARQDAVMKKANFASKAPKREQTQEEIEKQNQLKSGFAQNTLLKKQENIVKQDEEKKQEEKNEIENQINKIKESDEYKQAESNIEHNKKLCEAFLKSLPVGKLSNETWDVAILFIDNTINQNLPKKEGKDYDNVMKEINAIKGTPYKNKQKYHIKDAFTAFEVYNNNILNEKLLNPS